MKHALLLFSLLGTSLIWGQADYATPKACVESFFEAFHQQDTIMLRKATHQVTQLATIGKNQQGIVERQNTAFSDFLKSIQQIPPHIQFEERLLQIEVQQTDWMANAWVPYEFYINEN